MISVIITTKNEPDVFDAIDSVLNQSHENFELIVVDASEGALQESLEARCETKDITYLYQPDHEHAATLNGARNLGVEHSSGEIIAFLDGDCIADREWLENLLDYFENHDIVESNVTYASDNDKSCLMDRAVENYGLSYSFLGSGLAFRKEVWRTSCFDEDLEIFGDTAFGLVAIQNNFSYTYGARAEIKHYSGRYSIREFVSEHLDFQDLPKFFEKYGKLEKADRVIENRRMMLYPRELGLFVAAALALGASSYNAVIPVLLLAAIMAIKTGYYHKKEAENRELNFCPLDLLKMFFLIPISSILVKRFAIWRGAIKDRVPVI